MAQLRYEDILNFSKNYLILNYLGATFPLVTYKITFASLRALYSHKT